QVTEHAQEYLLNDGAQLPALLRGPLRVAGSPGLRGLASTTIKGQVRRLGQRFIMGATPQEALPTLRRLHSHGIGFTADLLGEATLSVEEAHAYVLRYLDLIDTFAERTAQWPEQPLVDFNHLGRVPRANVSIKVSALDPSLDVLDPAGSVARLMERLLPLFLRAKERFVFVNLDMEQWSLHEIVMLAFE